MGGNQSQEPKKNFVYSDYLYAERVGDNQDEFRFVHKSLDASEDVMITRVYDEDKKKYKWRGLPTSAEIAMEALNLEMQRDYPLLGLNGVLSQ